MLSKSVLFWHGFLNVYDVVDVFSQICPLSWGGVLNFLLCLIWGLNVYNVFICLSLCPLRVYVCVSMFILLFLKFSQCLHCLSIVFSLLIMCLMMFSQCCLCVYVVVLMLNCVNLSSGCVTKFLCVVLNECLCC